MNNKMIATLQKLLLYFANKDADDASLAADIQESYYDLSKTERETLIQTLKDMGNSYTLLIALSLLICDREDDKEILELLMDTVAESDLPVEEQLKYFIQCRYMVFVSFPELRNSLIRLYNRLYNDCASDVNLQLEYIPFNKRNSNKVLLITNQLLSERHSPTQLTANQWYFLTQIGYDVEILVMGESHIEPPSLWKAPTIRMVNVTEKARRFSINYYGYDIDGINISYETTDLIKQLALAMVVIKELNPAFIISLEDMCLAGDLASNFTTVITGNNSKEFPASASKYIIYNGELTGDDSEKELSKDKIIFKYLTSPVLNPPKEGNEESIEKLKNDKRFKVLVVGNRLDQELGNDFIKQMNNLTGECPDILYVIVGNCDYFKAGIESSAFAKYYFFTGFASNLPGITKECDIFLNPPRSGGGFSAKTALECGIPVITMGNCDVSSWTGPDYVCSDTGAIFEDAKKLYNDQEYLKSRSLQARERWESVSSSESEGIQRTKDFTTQLLNIIQNE